uniref:Profilin n=1 Tax=Zooxanthella nutricula TaxID=1333877 RepID=A0A7S2VQS4_9DINO|mmetsp:Transcript_93235/g.285346  ORF Transcript_93235/g.285346 Transcript_93235/m.285346 type:complete len:184 (+) Transcript_93235:107-658(+)
MAEEVPAGEVAAEDNAWGQAIEEWLISAGVCEAGALANREDGAMYAAAPVAGDAGWDKVWKDDYQVTVLAEDGVTEQRADICEAATLKQVADMQNMDDRPQHGLWLAGRKYVITGREVLTATSVNAEVPVVQAANKETKTAAVIAVAGSQIVVAITNEGKGQKPPNAINAVMCFAEYLINEGY